MIERDFGTRAGRSCRCTCRRDENTAAAHGDYRPQDGVEAELAIMKQPKVADYRRKLDELPRRSNGTAHANAPPKCCENLIETVVIHPAIGEVGTESSCAASYELTALLDLAAANESSPRSVRVLVAAEGFEPPTKGL